MTAVFEGLSRKPPEKPAEPQTSIAPAATPSVIGGGMNLVGELTARGDLRIEGQLKGTVRTEGEVVIAREGVVEGDVEAREIVVSGRVSGTIQASRAARFRNGCSVDAEIRSSIIEIEEGSAVNGRLVMNGADTAEHRPNAGTNADKANRFTAAAAK